MATSKATPADTTKQQALQKNLPLFFKNPHPLHAKRHGKAGLNHVGTFGFAADTNSVPLNVQEFFEAARSYPIVFTKTETPVPVALLGFKEENAFVDAQGRWRENSYIPAYVRRYPFILLEEPTDNKLILCVDEDAPHYTAEAPELPFYTSGEEANELMQNALNFCVAYQKHHQQTLEFTKALQKQGLLQEKASNLRMPDGREMNLSGFLMIDADKYAALSDETFLEWRKKGWLPAIEVALMSQHNWQALAKVIGDRAQ